MKSLHSLAQERRTTIQHVPLQHTWFKSLNPLRTSSSLAAACQSLSHSGRCVELGEHLKQSHAKRGWRPSSNLSMTGKILTAPKAFHRTPTLKKHWLHPWREDIKRFCLNLINNAGFWIFSRAAGIMHERTERRWCEDMMQLRSFIRSNPQTHTHVMHNLESRNPPITSV